MPTRQMNAVVIAASGPPAQSLAYRREPVALDTVGALFQPALRSLRFDGRMTGIFSAPQPQADFSVAEIYNRQLHLTGLPSVFMDGADVARIFDQLRPLFDRGLLAPRPCGRGRSRTAPRSIRRCWTGQPESSRFSCRPAVARKHSPARKLDAP
jgi:hypothetical protein